MANDWYPIINGKCNRCGDCIDSCHYSLLKYENGQIILNNYEKCEKNCNKCQKICSVNAIHYYNGTSESLLNSFSGVCSCH